MALTLAELIILGLLADWLFRRFRWPGLIGMLLLGVGLGPFVGDILDPAMLNISGDVRMIALIVILLRAGFELSKDTLARIGRMALLLSFIPATLELLAVVLVAPFLLGLTVLESAILGAILGAVSPAVVVPLMIRFIEQRRGVEKGIPTLVLAAASVDDVYVIVLYSALVGMYVGQSVNVVWQLASIPLAIVSGTLAGLLLGLVFLWLFRRFNPRATKRVLMIVGVSIILVRIEHWCEGIFPFAALLAVMAIGFVILEKEERFAHEISARLGKIWLLAEILLFTLVGAQVNIHVAWQAGLGGAAVIVLGLVARGIGTWLCLLGSDLTPGERWFVVVAYIPKATVQAAIGGAPLLAMKAAGMDLGPGEVILAVAVLSIVLTAPTGAWAIERVGHRVLAIAPEGESSAAQAAHDSDADYELLENGKDSPA